MTDYLEPSRQTSLGLPEPIERAGAYLGLFITGGLLLLTEKNQNVRHHAFQSIVASIFIFLPLFLVGALSDGFHWVLGNIWFIGWIFSLVFGGISGLAHALMWLIWLGLMLVAGFSRTKFSLPGTRLLK
jgi:uncharacterized membrane protein